MTVEKTPFDHIDYLVIEANSSCNLSCRTCNRSEMEEKGLRAKRNLSMVEFKAMLQPFRKLNLETIKFEWLSEPMLHPQFDLLAEHLRHSFPQAQIIIATNLQYEVPSTPFVKTLPFVDMVYLSIDGVGTNYERTRRGAKFDRLLKSLNQVRQTVSQEDRARKLHIQVTINEENWQDLDEIYLLRQEYGLASVRINVAQDWRMGSSQIPILSQEAIEKLKAFKTDVKGVPGWKFQNCFWPTRGITVDVFGEIRQCIIKTDSPSFGNVFKDDVRQIYNESNRYLQNRRLLSQNKAPEECRTCSYAALAPMLEKIFGDDHTLWPKPKLPMTGES